MTVRVPKAGFGMDTDLAIGLDRITNAGEVAGPLRADADYVFHELTRNICPNCRRVVDAKILLRDNKVYMSKRCPQCGPFMSLVYGDAEAYISFARDCSRQARLRHRHGNQV